jgi:hypothetical protein
LPHSFPTHTARRPAPGVRVYPVPGPKVEGLSQAQQTARRRPTTTGRVLGAAPAGPLVLDLPTAARIPSTNRATPPTGRGTPGTKRPRSRPGKRPAANRVFCQCPKFPDVEYANKLARRREEHLDHLVQQCRLAIRRRRHRRAAQLLATIQLQRPGALPELHNLARTVTRPRPRK